MLREALALLFAPKGMFQLGEVDDAAECFESIIEHVHCAACGISEAEGGRDQSCGYPPCPSCAQFKVLILQIMIHATLNVLLLEKTRKLPLSVLAPFSQMSFFDQASCTECSATGEPSFEDQFIYRVYVDEVLKVETFSQMQQLHKDNTSNLSAKHHSPPAARHRLLQKWRFQRFSAEQLTMNRHLAHWLWQRLETAAAAESIEWVRLLKQPKCHLQRCHVLELSKALAV